MKRDRKTFEASTLDVFNHPLNDSSIHETISCGFKHFSWTSSILDVPLNNTSKLRKLVTFLESKKKRLCKRLRLKPNDVLYSTEVMDEETLQLKWIVQVCIILQVLIKTQSLEKLSCLSSLSCKVVQNDNSSLLGLIMSTQQFFNLGTILSILQTHKSAHAVLLTNGGGDVSVCIIREFNQWIKSACLKEPYDMKTLRQMYLLIKYIHPNNTQHLKEIKRHSAICLHLSTRKMKNTDKQEAYFYEYLSMIQYLMTMFPNKLELELPNKAVETGLVDLSLCKSCLIHETRYYMKDSEVNNQMSSMMQELTRKHACKVSASTSWTRYF